MGLLCAIHIGMRGVLQEGGEGGGEVVELGDTNNIV